MHTASLRDELLAKTENMKIMPMLDSVVNELSRIMNDETSSLTQLFNVVRYDQAISSKIISIANSAYYSTRSNIVNLERAMVVIGFEGIKNIVTCLAAINGTFNQPKLNQGDLTALWTRSLVVGYAAKTLSSKTMVEDPEKVFTASILHDIGRIVFCTLGDRYRRVTDEARKAGRDLYSLERETFGIDHQEVGYFLSIKWRFPEEFSAVIRGHHARPEGKDPLVDLVRTANMFIDHSGADLGAQGIILQKEKGRIMDKARRISELLRVIDAGGQLGE